MYVAKKLLESVHHVAKFTGQLISVLEFPGNSNDTSFLRLITFDFKVDVDQSVVMLESLFKYSVTNQNGRDIPLFCKTFYTLGPCTFEAGVHYLELVQTALHRHKYTTFLSIIMMLCSYCCVCIQGIKRKIL